MNVILLLMVFIYLIYCSVRTCCKLKSKDCTKWEEKDLRDVCIYTFKLCLINIVSIFLNIMFIKIVLLISLLICFIFNFLKLGACCNPYERANTIEKFKIIFINIVITIISLFI